MASTNEIRPGILSTLSFQDLGRAERNIAKNLAKKWFITFARKQNFKSVDYELVFLKPTTAIRENFHLSREVLLIFSPFQKFEPRTFDFVDKILEDFKSRLDKLCVVIVSRDLNIGNEIRDIIMQDKESRIIISYTYDELLGTNYPQIIEQRLKTSFYSRDLFSYETPLKNETYFFGRQDVIQALYGKYNTGQCGSLFGLRRIGKTSVLNILKRTLETREEPVVYIDCSNPSFYFKRWHETLHIIITNLIAALNLQIDISSKELYTEEDAAKYFEHDLKQIHIACNNQRILIILDEIENITFNLSPKEHWSKNNDFIYFWQTIRSIFQANQTLISIIIAGVNPTAIETSIVNNMDNPIYRFIQPMYLQFFSIGEIKEMVATIGNYMGVSFEDNIFAYFLDDFGGHPFIVRQVCSRLIEPHKERPLNIAKFEYDEKRQLLIKSTYDYLDLIIKILKEKYREEYEMLELLAIEEYDTFNEMACAYPSMIEHLIGYGLIKENSGNYYFNMKAVRGYIIEKSKLEKKANTIEEKWAQVGLLRNKLEANLRVIVKNTLKHRLGNSKAKEVVASIISDAKIKATLSALSFDDIMKDKLYFEDLRKIIQKEYSHFELIIPIGDKGKFDDFMKLINQKRIDAHAKDMEYDDLVHLNIAIKWITDKIKDYI